MTDFKHLWADASISDVTFRVGGEDFQLCKFPLIAKSKVVREMVISVPATTHPIELDCPGGARAFEVAARFCYGFTPVLEDVGDMTPVLQAADFLGMEGKGNLMEVCQNIVEQAFENVKPTKDIRYHDALTNGNYWHIAENDRASHIGSCIKVLRLIRKQPLLADRAADAAANLAFSLMCQWDHSRSNRWEGYDYSGLEECGFLKHVAVALGKEVLEEDPGIGHIVLEAVVEAICYSAVDKLPFNGRHEELKARLARSPRNRGVYNVVVAPFVTMPLDFVTISEELVAAASAGRLSLVDSVDPAGGGSDEAGERIAQLAEKCTEALVASLRDELRGQRELVQQLRKKIQEGRDRGYHW